MTVKRVAFALALLASAFITPTQAQAQTREPAPPTIKVPSGTKVYIVQLAGAPVASYSGGLRGFTATRPVLGARLDMRAPNVRAYMSRLDSQRSAVLARIGNVKPLHTYGVTFNGFAAELSDAQVQTLLSSADVLSVVESERRAMDTTRTPDFLGLSAPVPSGIWSVLDAQSRAVKGEDVIIGMIDSGIWPENPSFGDKVDPATGEPVSYAQAGTLVYGAPPARWAGICQTGDGFTAAMCNNKLIGARVYSAGFLAGGAVPTAAEFLSPRDGGGHGSHTSSTAGGNGGVRNRSAGIAIGIMSGVAPRARIATYKICWEATVAAQTGCYTADTLRAIDDAVADGVDVINFSISGTETDLMDPVEIAFLNASAAGVFVAASAGNAGPGNEVAHISPWLTSVGASTLDRQPGADLRLGNGSTYTGFSNNFAAAPTAPMVLSSDIPAAGATVANATLCAANSLDAALAAGKIVVCDRSTNNAATRLAESAEVKRAGGVGMVLLNPTATTLALDAHTVPTVHIQNTSRDAVRAYVTAGAATGTITLSYNVPGIVAPVMAGFSSRGPNKANANIMKPDITGPGSSVVAGYIATLTSTQHNALVAGTFTPGSAFATLSGTSMSSPHLAGSAALLRQLNPTWSPAAIKSALMTTTTGVKLSGGAADTNRWGYGAGHENPNGAALPGLVYDAGPNDYGRFLCGVNLTPPAGIGSCNTIGKTSPWNLNLASLTAANVIISRTLTRTVKNVGNTSSTYIGNATLPGWTVLLSPNTLTLAPGASATFTAELTRTTAALGSWTFGNLSWTDSSRSVSSPLSALALALATPAELSDKRSTGKGSKVFSIESSYTGSLTVTPTGLVPAVLNTGTVLGGGKQCYNFVVPAGVQFARFQTFNSDTLGGSATDLDLEVFNAASGTGTSVGSSAGTTADESVTLENPAARTYSACVSGFAVPAGGASYTLSAWIVGPASGTQTLRATGPSTVYERGAASVALGWLVDPGQRYMGNVQFFDGSASLIGATKLLVDNR